MASFPWFRYYSETQNDKKLDLIAEESGMHILMVQGAWSVLLCLANDSPIRGALYVTTVKRYSNIYVAKQLQLSLKDTEILLKLFSDYAMINTDDNGAICISNWDRRQFKSDSSVDRVRRFRENKKKDEDGNDGVTLHETLPSVSVSVSDSVSEYVNSQEESKSFKSVQSVFEKLVGVGGGKAAIDAIDDIVKMGATEDDMRAGLDWFRRNNDKPVKWYSQLVGPTRTAMQIRLQGAKPNALDSIVFENVGGNNGTN